MELEEVKKIAEPYLKANPNKEKIFVCSDGNCFWEKNPAINHARTIKGQYFEYPALQEVEEKPKEPKKNKK